MMNARILEIIKNPDLIEKDDLGRLESEIENHPYIQSIRALQLYGVHRHRPDDYQNILSKTAAFTTDKKILYQFINKVPASQQEPKPVVAEEIAAPVTQISTPFTDIASVPKGELKPVYVNGVLNRILFEGEEDFLERDHAAIDLEQTKETGLIVTQTANKPQDSPTKEVDAVDSAEVKTEQVTDQAETLIENTEPTQHDEQQVPEAPAEETVAPEAEPQAAQSLNFHGTDKFLPEIKSAAKPIQPEAYTVPKAVPNKHEEEMQRLIAEVEAKMKTRKKQTQPEEETVNDTGLDFADVQDFAVTDVILKQESPEIDGNIPTEETSEFTTSETAEKPVVDSVEETVEHREWKPMVFPGTTPDTLIKKNIEREAETSKNTDKQNVEASDEPVAATEESAFNISFFTQKVSSLETEKADELIEDVKKHIEEDAAKEESNVPVFINTWQNWLKIDKNRTEDTETASKEEEKNKAIETFIVKEPRISKLREESDFVVKERSDNISHLMTETLAKLYAEQKLYAKAIKAYQILTEKYPEKKSYFAEQIKIIKDLRQTKQP
ncbi:hypothetical protein FIC_00077 [Flavobacteriaceae bacterium 3519-10]|nr:hypothetical protein FIC_00077 [Flavobacteriaceae bacterium 3519-10]